MNVREIGKPVRKCHKCLLNMGRFCWGFTKPRNQWRHRRGCGAFKNEIAYTLFRQWQASGIIKTSKQLRREEHRTRTVPESNHLAAVPLDGVIA